MTLSATKYSRSVLDTFDPPPPISVHYFYNSPLHLDDLLAHVPPPPASAPPSTASHVLRPYSDYDNDALDKAWNAMRRNTSRAFDDAQRRACSAHTSGKEAPSSPSRQIKDAPKNATVHHRQIEGLMGSVESRFSSATRRERSVSAQRSVAKSQDSQDRRERFRSGSIREWEDQKDTANPLELEAESHGLTGMPFVRAPARNKMPSSLRDESPSTDHDDNRHDGSDNGEPSPAETSVTVGVARIHHVLMPKLAMEPIYWNPVHDVFHVVRGTWFYKDTMLPVEADIANLLEMGYLDLRPWTETWNDELNSATEAGALGEEKIAHNLWPASTFGDATSVDRTDTAVSATMSAEEETPEQKRKRILDAAGIVLDSSGKDTSVDNKAVGSISDSSRDGQKKLYLQSSVIYVNERDAIILRPNLAPSAYYGRRPYANYIRKGFKIGVRVVRGFDRTVFERLIPSKGGENAQKSQRIPLPIPPSDAASSRIFLDPKNPAKTATLPVTDLILVIHGIGQKLSERVESFHFTHAMNAFRREVNVELGMPTVGAHMRSNMGGIMVLPVNWRSTLSFEEGGYSDRDADALHNKFSLRDITPESLPSIRNIVSDVMLDIPYYLSHHQPKIISAVIKEANRIYRLWCNNNPGFPKSGRVHLIAHSLGSVMAMDILSKQPTFVDMAVSDTNSEAEHFAFDTKNLFLCGSPAGFFLLLKKAGLIPRKDRHKASSDGEDWAPEVSGAKDTYGCLAVDNIYNIVNPYDPVAYLLNAAIDTAYAASLKPAYVPSSSKSWFSFGITFRGSSNASAAPQRRPPPAIQRLPSSVELETHNFTREEIAEERAFLLNDNGQIDYYLRYGGGPLEIQYLTMLGAHSSYWISQDFIRFVVIETSRRSGKQGTLEATRAVKKSSTA